MGKIRRKRAGKRQNKKRGKVADQPLLQRAMEWHRKGALAEAQQAYGAFLEKHPRHADALGNYGLLLHGDGEVERAVSLYEQAVALNPSLSHLFYHLGNGLCLLGRPEQAIMAYKKALQGGHCREETLLQLGEIHFERGNLSEAQHCFAEILRRQPDDVDALYQSGLVHYTTGQFTNAADCFTAALALQAENTDICFNLALCYKALAEYETALQLLRQAEQLSPNDSDILYNIGVTLRLLGDDKAAEAAFLRVLEHTPDHGMCRTDLAVLYHIQNRLEEAADSYQQALASGYCPGSARHMLSALNGVTTASAPLEHVQDLFNNFAGTFDQSLIHDLRYTIPKQLVDMFRSCQPAITYDSALDLGCGTGLSGLAFQGLCEQLIGVDLAENMLAQAKERGVYETLYCIDIVHFLETTEDQFNLIVAADVFVYLGELESFFLAIASVLQPNGILLFSVETCDGAYCLRPSGRYAHSPEYITELARRFNFSVVHTQRAEIRWERGQWIVGELYMLSVCS